VAVVVRLDIRLGDRFVIVASFGFNRHTFSLPCLPDRGTPNSITKLVISVRGKWDDSRVQDDEVRLQS